MSSPLHYSLPFHYSNGNEVMDLKRDSVQRAIGNKIQGDSEDSIYVTHFHQRKDRNSLFSDSMIVETLGILKENYSYLMPES